MQDHACSRLCVPLQTCKSPGTLNEEKLDTAIDLFDRNELPKGNIILTEGSSNTRLYIVRGGTVEATSGGETVQLQQSGGFTYFGDDAMMVRLLALTCSGCLAAI